MKLAWLVLLSALAIVALGGCQQEEATNTPPPAAVIQSANQALMPSLLTLLRNPSDFEGEDLILTGAYRSKPLLVCSEETHQSPATWVLADGDVEVMASGFDSALRALAAPGLPLEVEGRWQRWEGPVGCGRRAPSQLVWHLQVTNIVSPNPLSASLPFTAAPAEPIGTTPPPTALAETIATASPTAQTTAALEQPPRSGNTPTPGLPGTSAADNSLTATSTLSTNVTATVTGTIPAGASGTATPTPFGTPTPASGLNTPTPTATASPAGSTPTATAESTTPILLDYDDLSKRNMASGGVREWQFAGATDLPIVIQVAPTANLDVSLELLDPSDARIDTYNQSGAGGIETVNESDLPAAGLYTLRVSSVGQSSGSYAIVLQSESSLPAVLFQGSLTYGETRAGTTPVDGDHLWNFEGVAGDVINIRVRATTPTDMQIYLNNHDGQETEFVNDNSVYSPPEDREEILGFRLPASGLYTVGIGEEELEALGYTIVIERAS